MKAVISRLGVALLGLAAGLFATTASAQQFTMKVSFPTINDVTHEFFKTMKAGIEQRSGGRIKVDIYPANQLGQIPAVVEGVALGTIEVGGAATGFFVGLEPRFQVFDAPGLFDDTQHAFRVLTDPEIRKRLATLGADKGVEMLVAGTYGQTAMLSHKAVRGVADFQGLKVRTPGGSPIQVEPFRKLGILPVSLPLGDALPAMQNKTIDGLATALAVYVNFKYHDIAKAVTYMPATTLLAPALINRQFLKSIGPELEAIVREEALKAEVVYTDWNVAYTKRIEEAWLKNGGELITFSPAEAKRYVDVVSPVSRQILSANPKVKEDYEVLLAAAQKYRK
jgi:TRAP-type transport system periplasmic protein